MKTLDVLALLPHTKAGRNTFGEVRGPEHSEDWSFDMSFRANATSLPARKERPVKIGDLMPAVMARIAAVRGAK